MVEQQTYGAHEHYTLRHTHFYVPGDGHTHRGTVAIAEVRCPVHGDVTQEMAEVACPMGWNGTASVTFLRSGPQCPKDGCVERVLWRSA